MHRLLEEYLPKLGMQTRKWILDAAAVACLSCPDPVAGGKAAGL